MRRHYLYAHLPVAPFVLLLLSSPAANCVATISLFKADAVPSGDWNATDTWAQVPSESMCAAWCLNSGKYFYSYEKEQKTCEVGVAHMKNSGNGDKKIKYRDMTSEIPLLGLALGNSAYDRDLELLLPNGRSCPASDHALPAFALGAEKMTMYNGVAEVAGTVFKCAGKTSDGGIGNCYSLELTRGVLAPLSWKNASPLDQGQARWVARGGLVPYQKEQGGEAYKLFLLTTASCSDPGIYMYDSTTESWSTVVNLSSRLRHCVAYDERYIFIGGGALCASQEDSLSYVESYDMKNPQTAPVTLNNGFITERQHASCGVITMQDNRRGLLVVGGWQSNLARKNVWFIPLSGGQSTGPAEDLTVLPVRNYKGFLFTFGSKAVLYGGMNENDAPSNSLLVWNEVLQKFEDLGYETSYGVEGRGVGFIGSKHVLKYCLKYL